VSARAGDEARASREREIRAGLVALVTPELVAEHGARPSGHHSPALAQLLAYFAQAPVARKLAILATVPGREWRILAISGSPLAPHGEPGPEVFASAEAARHAVFLRRLEALGVPASVLRPDAPGGVHG